MVSVDLKHNVYLLMVFERLSLNQKQKQTNKQKGKSKVLTGTESNEHLNEMQRIPYVVITFFIESV